MYYSENKPPLIVLVGPTAAGKTEAALGLARRLGGEIISADSRLFYRGMDIGTAKPSISERSQISHHLIDVADPDETWSLAVFQKAARTAIASVQFRHRLPILVGGTGQFIRSVIENWSIPEQEPDYRIRGILESWGLEIGPVGLHDRLAVLDPDAAAMIDPRNVRRTIRALEVCIMTGRRFSTQRRKRDTPYNVLFLGLTRTRQELYARIDARIDDMISNGFVGEVQSLLNRGYSKELPSFSAIGYKEISAYLSGECTLESAISEMKKKTRIFVRRQANWFKSDDPEIKWFSATDKTVDQMEITIRNFYFLDTVENA